jgi:hypothetical protein
MIVRGQPHESLKDLRHLDQAAENTAPGGRTVLFDIHDKL